MFSFRKEITGRNQKTSASESFPAGKLLLGIFLLVHLPVPFSIDRIDDYNNLVNISEAVFHIILEIAVNTGYYPIFGFLN